MLQTLSGADFALFISVFLACTVEVVEAVPEPENEPQVAVDVDAPKMPPAPIAVTVATPIKTPARVAALAATAEANQVFVHSNKSKISPLLKRLQALRDAMDAA